MNIINRIMGKKDTKPEKEDQVEEQAEEQEVDLSDSQVASGAVITDPEERAFQEEADQGISEDEDDEEDDDESDEEGSES